MRSTRIRYIEDNKYDEDEDEDDEDRDEDENKDEEDEDEDEEGHLIGGDSRAAQV